jgi:hypothetical protein
MAGLVTAALAIGVQTIGQLTQQCPADNWAQGPVLLIVLIGGTITVMLAWLVNRVGCLASFALGVCLADSRLRGHRRAGSGYGRVRWR